ncbi:MAG: hypothetical protein ACJ79T_19880 [Myxococcales bacterium]
MLAPLVLAAAAAASPDAGFPPGRGVPPSVRAMLPDRKPGAALPLFALGAPDLVEALGSLRVEVGAWAEYLLRSRDGTARMRFSLLPPKLEGGRYWLEVAAFSDVALPFALRAVLLPGPVVPANMERATLYVLGQAPLEVPMDDLKERVSRAAPVPSRARISHGPTQTLSTEAGRFKANELRITARGETTRIWRSDQVPLWGLVRSKGPKETIELVGFSREGARSAIPEPGQPPPDQGKGKDSTNQ